ncbi:carnitine O-acetyltransferase YAT2 KNAG_0F03710 [Huiozyma naganishii CBS 8797]|uniref:Choline/carnitine acyltransferase domain-containing protein n=1 Tax=Huiozyma naganishii (strain ATCC MYA-139 / BCRC 22969 / CBS 8797 / KCTC 17520 / NBRC 10181 / NCYC 3082 / Yp74L-3) TaxID=1071383 RepID=J7RNC1_HUIN7|nr:hypothetical protein KNAG_0F03710 [Kazachstania naganishii CBS 8797]CCK71033.1 hypothetical protein KNAG_0F03710 [Kazachstania naganishii CBS 8797]
MASAGTFGHEAELPRLPLPAVSDTLAHLKKSLEPLYYADGYYKHPLDPVQLQRLEDVLKQFANSEVVGKLQDKLKQFQVENMSYLDDLHLDVNNQTATRDIQDDLLPRNPFLILADDATPDISQVDRSAVLVHSALRFISALRKNQLPPDVNSKTGQYLTMYPYLNLFGTTRCPVFEDGEVENFDLNKPFTASDLDEFLSESEEEELQRASEQRSNDASAGDNNTDDDAIIGHGIKMGKYSDSGHILIISRGQYYTMDVLDENNDIICKPADLSKFISYVLHDSETAYNMQQASTALGSLTSHSFKNWKYARKRLQKRYPQELHLIDSALFVLVLDESTEKIEPNFNNVYTTNNDYVPEFDQERSANCKRVLYGTSIIDQKGHQVGSCVSRWFDKLQLVVTADSKAAVIWDSFTCDGSVVLRFASEMYTESVLRLAKEVNANDSDFSLWSDVKQTKLPIYENYSKLDPQAVVRKIDWSFSNILNTHVHLSETKLADLISKYDIVRVSLPMGRRSAQRLGIKPDSMIQVALQVAHYALYGQMIFALEPISTRAFKNSRSSFINIQNQDLLELCQLFISSSIDGPGKLDKFIQTCEKHNASVKSAKSGAGYEKHLNALQYLFRFHKEFGIDLDDYDKSIATELFDSSLIEPFLQPELIAANCGNAATTTFGITPAVPQGFGVGYIIKDDQTDLTVTSQFRQGKRLMFMLNWVLKEIKAYWRAARHTAHNKNGVKISPIVDKIYEMDNALKKESEDTRKSRSKVKSSSHSFLGFDYFDMDAQSRSASQTPRRARETMDNSSHKLSLKLAELAMTSNSGLASHSPISVPTENEKLHTGHQIAKLQPVSITETPEETDSGNTSPQSFSRPESKRPTNVISSKFEINFDRSDVGRKVFSFE